MITIDGLAKKHVELLDTMWSIHDLEVYDQWKSSLSEQLQDLVDVLEELVLYETLEESLQDFSEAKQLLNKFAL
jgi:hypothetical protein